MESWRRELYQGLKHSVEGSEWKDHKYIAIVDGRYIYPEDVQNGPKSTVSSNLAGSSNTSTSSVPSKATKKPKKVGDQKDKDGKKVPVTDKGSVKSYRYLPTDAQIGDMYLLEDTQKYVYWNGQVWTPIKEGVKEGAVAENTGVGGGSGKKDDASEAVEGISQSTLDRAREAVKKLNSSGSGSSGSTKKKQIDTHQKSWDQRKAAGKVSSSSSVSSVKNSKSASTGKTAIGSALRSLVSKAISSLKSSSISTGSKVVSRTRGAQR